MPDRVLPTSEKGRKLPRDQTYEQTVGSTYEFCRGDVEHTGEGLSLNLFFPNMTVIIMSFFLLRFLLLLLLYYAY